MMDSVLYEDMVWVQEQIKQQFASNLPVSAVLQVSPDTSQDVKECFVHELQVPLRMKNGKSIFVPFQSRDDGKSFIWVTQSSYNEYMKHEFVKRCAARCTSTTGVSIQYLLSKPIHFEPF